MNEDARERVRKLAREKALELRRQKLGAKSQAGPPSWRVTAQDLKTIDGVKTLLTALNDAYVGAAQVLTLVEQVPVLKARCIRRATEATELDAPPDLPEALKRIGNMGLESELLGVLEDMTLLSAEMAEQQ